MLIIEEISGKSPEIQKNLRNFERLKNICAQEVIGTLKIFWLDLLVDDIHPIFVIHIKSILDCL